MFNNLKYLGGQNYDACKKSQNWLPGIFNDFFGNEWIEKSQQRFAAINIIESDTDYKVELACAGNDQG